MTYSIIEIATFQLFFQIKGWMIGADGQHGLIGQKPGAPQLFHAAFWNIWALFVLK